MLVEALHLGFALLWGALLYKDKLALPKDSPFVLLALQEGYDSKVGGLADFLKTYKRVVETFYWRGMKKDHSGLRSNFCNLQNKYSTLTPAGLLQPLSILEKVWDDKNMDFIEGLPKSEGFDSI